MSSTPARYARLVGDDADRLAVEPREADDDVLREVRCTSKNSPSSHHAPDHLRDVVGLGWAGRGTICRARRPRGRGSSVGRR